MSPSQTAVDWQDAVRGYRLLMRERLATAVEAQHHSPTAMLLDCRQVVEALLLALFCARMQRAEDNSRAQGRGVEDLESLLHRVKQRSAEAQELPTGVAYLTDDALAHIESLRTNANRVVHVRAWVPGDPWPFVKSARASLAGLLRWGFSESAIAYTRVSPSAAERALPAWEPLLTALDGPIVPAASPAEALSARDAAHSNALADRDAALAAVRAEKSSLDASLAKANAALDALRAEHLHLQAEAKSLRTPLALVEAAHQKERDALRKKLATAEARAQAQAPGCFSQMARGAGFALGTGLLVSLVAGAFAWAPLRAALGPLLDADVSAGLGVFSATGVDVSSAGVDVSSAAVDGSDGPTAADARAEPAPAPRAGPPAPAATASTCPEGMVRVAGGTVHLGQPEGGRAHWPRPTRRSLSPVEVPDFCVMPAAVTWGELSDVASFSAVLSGACRGEAIQAERGGVPHPAGCLAAGEVLAYCRGRFGDAARPPRIIEWEWLATAPPPAVDTTLPRDEWAADSFPPSVFARSEADSGVPGMFRQPLPPQSTPLQGAHARWSWNQTSDRRWSLGFRCALPLGA